MRFDWRLELPQWILIAGMFALAAAVWPTAPETMPIHWNVRGEVNGWGGKFTGLLLLPLTTLGLYLLLLLLPRIDPRRASYARFAGAYAVLRLALTVFLAAIYVITVLAALNRPVDVGPLICFLVGGLLVVIGLVLPKVQPNWFVGVRTPWTLSSRLAWEKTHRLGGWVFVAMGLAVALAGLLGTGWAFALMMAIVIGGTLGLVVYSYFIWRDDPDKMPWNGQGGR